MHRRTFLATAATLAVTPFAFANPRPVVWQINESEWYLAPTLEEAIQCSMAMCGQSREDVYSPGYGSEPVSDEELERMPYFYDDYGNPRSGLEVYRELLAEGKTVQPFTACGD